MSDASTDQSSSTEEVIKEGEHCIYDPTCDQIKTPATHVLIMKRACWCAPARVPLCPECHQSVRWYLEECGPENWDCIRCDSTSDVLDVRPIR